MATEVYIPKLGQTVEEVKLVEWLVADGATVEAGQELFEVETDKTNFRVEATASGILRRGPFVEGQVVPVLTVVAVIGRKDEGFGETRAQGNKETKETSGSAADHQVAEAPSDQTANLPGHRVPASPRARKLASEKGLDLAQAAITPTGGGGARVAERDVLAYLQDAHRAGVKDQGAALVDAVRPVAVSITPVARRIAEEAGLDWQTLAGAGPRGQITKEDVEQAIAQRSRRAEEQGGGGAEVQLPASSRQLPASEITERIPLKGIRAIIADRMGTSVHTTARVTLMTEGDATEFVALRGKLKAKVEQAWGFAPGYNDLLALIVARVLRRYPYMNARLAPSTGSGQGPDAIELLAHVNLGMAVDTERGLLVPVIRDADKKSLRQFGTEFRTLVDRARQGRSLPDDLTGGSFTITNLGMYDVDAFTPVINLPEAAILGVGRIAPKWVYRPESPNAPVLRQMWTLSLVFDHRLVDGAPAARFLQHIKALIEEPYLWLAE